VRWLLWEKKERESRQLADLRGQRRELVVVEVKLRECRELADFRGQCGKAETGKVKVRKSRLPAFLDPL